jgi:hypothetical protein
MPSRQIADVAKNIRQIYGCLCVCARITCARPLGTAGTQFTQDDAGSAPRVGAMCVTEQKEILQRGIVGSGLKSPRGILIIGNKPIHH